MNPIYIFGHRNPDTDTICSTIAYAEYKNIKGFKAAGVRLGELNDETKFVLKFFSADEPEMLKTIKTQVSDLEIDSPVSIHPDVSLRTAWFTMRQNNRKALTVAEDGLPLAGIVTLSDITGCYMDILDDTLLLKSGTPLRNIKETLTATLVCGREEDFHPTGRVLVAALESDKLKNFVKKGDIVIAGNREESVIEAINCGANVIIATCSILPGKQALETAKGCGCIILTTPVDTFIAARLIHQSVPVRYVMTKDNLVSVNIDDFTDDVREKMLKTRYRSYPVVDEDMNVLGMVSRYHLISKKRKQAVLLDHNEKSQTAPGIEDAHIIEIIDHHRLGDIQTSAPILMKNEPVGSTATIIAKLFLAEKELLTQKMAGLLLSAILSDTLKFVSPTATQEDMDTALQLAEIAEIDIEDFARKLFNAASNLKGKTVDQIINGDLKEYDMGKYKIGMAQLYSVDFESIEDMKETLMDRLDYYCGKNGFALLALLVTDLYRNGSEVMFTGDRKDMVIKAFSLDPDATCAFLPGVLSRKKQVVPKIMAIENEGI
jgi:manganese-dependent inorganic pyrophosphatase